ncbi:peptidase S10, serine carboxypeptidase, Alpha/Beta hydrolase fold protein [Artemisia annua]|uniref:Peptidase S10, serine carboxypeptidase, Alpha/Beta hydrolase fold protein n=1 Tax=Artemisia annua TaxID=35608 RepID=A0A2U1NSA6_ARTAN|nr:peptidase S10, serine carboxypeptidase, Alpha/Beta hydrolase fold protein [Artemisia annua]
MEKLGVNNLDFGEVGASASELLRSVEATSSLSYVTMRKNKKSHKNAVDAEQVEKTIGSLGAELNTNATIHGINVEPIPHVSSSLHDSGVESSLKSKHDLIDTLFGVSIKNLVDLDAFLKGLDAGNYPMWDTLDADVVRMVHVALSGLYDAFKAEYQADPESNATYSDGNGNGTAPNVNLEVAEPVFSITLTSVGGGVFVAEARCGYVEGYKEPLLIIVRGAGHMGGSMLYHPQHALAMFSSFVGGILTPSS